jgi:hypothetical protein
MRKCFLRYHTFLLLVSNWTIAWGVDDITAVKAPNSVVAGTVVPVAVSYVASTDRDIMVNFQLNSDPWTVFGHKRISVSAGSSTLVIPVAIHAATPAANHTFKFGVSLLPTSVAGWPERMDTMVQEQVSCFLAPQMFTVYPAEYSGALRNPLKGFRPNTYRNNYDDEYATITRCYLKWNELENDVNDSVQKIKDVCDQKWTDVEQYGIKVVPRVYLDWNEEPGNEYWPADMTTGDYSSEQFKQRLVRLISRLGECWDDDPRVAWVQMGFIGRWGEHHNPEPTAEIQELMGDAFTQAFQNKKFLVRHANEFTDYDVGVYWDSWAHIQQVDKTQHGAGIDALNDSTDRWKTHPIEGETAYNWGQSDIQPGDGPDDTLTDPIHRDFLIDTIRKLHCSGLGWIASYNQDDPTVRAGAEEVQKAFGYRFVIPHFCWGQRAEPDGSLHLLFSVINTGSAPFYEDWPLEFSLLDPDTGDLVWKTLLEGVDIRQWLPGDNWDEGNDVYLDPPLANEVDVNVTLPGFSRLPEGEYIAALAIVDPIGQKPSLRFAVNNYLNGGRHPLGRVGIGLDTAGNHFLDNTFFDDPMQDEQLSYLMQAPPSPDPARIKGISISDGMCRIQGEDSASETLRVIQRSNDLSQWDAVDVSLGIGSDFEWIEPIIGKSNLFFRVLTE